MRVQFRHALFAPTLAIALALAGGAQATAGEETVAYADGSENRPVSALSPADRLSYTTAFDALRRGDLEAARASARQAQDRILLGQVEFERLFHPDYTATYE